MADIGCMPGQSLYSVRLYLNGSEFLVPDRTAKFRFGNTEYTFYWETPGGDQTYPQLCRDEGTYTVTATVPPTGYRFTGETTKTLTPSTTYTTFTIEPIPPAGPTINTMKVNGTTYTIGGSGGGGGGASISVQGTRLVINTGGN